MQSSYRVIKSSRVVENGNALINTKYSLKELSQMNNNAKIISSPYDDNQNERKKIINEAINEADLIKTKAENEAQILKKDAYDKGFSEGKNVGFSEGKNEGYNEGYNLAMKNANDKANEIINNANSILIQAKEEYNRYVDEKDSEIKNLIMEISHNILKRELSDKDGLNSMIFDVVKSIKDTKVVIIKCNNLYYEEIKNNIEKWKKMIVFKGDFFVIEDNSLDMGEAIIEKDNGLMKVDIEYGIDKVKEALMEM